MTKSNETESERENAQASGVLRVGGFEIWKGFLDLEAQRDLIEDLRPILKTVPLVTPTTARGKQMSVRMTSAGAVGWISDQAGYRYQDHHPSGTPWPGIPDSVLEIWSRVTGLEKRPDTCLINYYGEGARMGLHQDKDEADFAWPVVSVSLGDDGLFRMGGVKRSGPTESVWLNSGDVVVMGGAARLSYHGVDRTRFRSSRLLPKGGRLNLTLRVAR